MNTHRSKYCLVGKAILLTNISLELASFLELCGIVYLRKLLNDKKIKYLNEQTGYDNWRILDTTNVDETNIYMFASLDGLRKKMVRTTGKLSHINSPIETKKQNLWFDFTRKKNYKQNYHTIDFQMKLLHRVNVVCDVGGCHKAFTTDLGNKNQYFPKYHQYLQQVFLPRNAMPQIRNTHTTRLRMCSLPKRWQNRCIQKHCAQKECLHVPKTKRITIPKR